MLTEAKIALLSRLNSCLPRRTAAGEPRKRQPMDVMDSIKWLFSAVGRKVALCRIGKRGLKRVKYVRTQRF